MSQFECPHEQDVLDALASRRWPARAEPELRDHVASCALCADLVTVAGALLEAGAEEPAGADLAPASLVWWRAQLRAREEGARAALRPIRLAQGAAAACVVALLLLAISVALPHVWDALAGAVSGVPVPDAHAAITRVSDALPTFDTEAAAQAAMAVFASRNVQLALGAWLILAPVAIYLAFARD